jgi:hypothetical protein
VRFVPKNFKQRRLIGLNKWEWSTKGVRRVLYRLPELLAAAQGTTVYIPEGEKDVDNLRAQGLVATCNSGGAGQWLASYSPFLAGRHVVILADNDAPGRAHALKVATALKGVAASVRVLELPGLPPAGDVSDWLASGNTIEQFQVLAKAAPVFEPTSAGALPWPDPVPLGEVPEVLPFPLDVFPQSLKGIVSEIAVALPCPPDYVAMPLLVMAASAIGGSRALAIKPGHIQRSILYGAVISPPGSGKTPAQDVVVEPVREVEERLHAAWEKAMVQYEAQLEAYETAKKDCKKPAVTLPRNPHAHC